MWDSFRRNDVPWWKWRLDKRKPWVFFNQAFLVRGLTRPSMLLPCLVAFIGLPGWGSHSCQEMAWPDGLNAMARGFWHMWFCDCVSFNFSYSTNLSSFQSAFSQNLSGALARWICHVSSQIFAFPHPVHFAMSVRALPSCSCLFCSAFVILGVWPKVAHGAIFIKGVTWCLSSPACLRPARFIISSVRNILTF